MLIDVMQGEYGELSYLCKFDGDKYKYFTSRTVQDKWFDMLVAYYEKMLEKNARNQYSTRSTNSFKVPRIYIDKVDVFEKFFLKPMKIVVRRRTYHCKIIHNFIMLLIDLINCE